MTTTRFPCITGTWPKRGFWFILVCAIIYFCYIGFLMRQDVTTLYMSVVSSFQGQEFDQLTSTFMSIQDNFTIDKHKWQQTSMYKIFDKHKSRTGESCVNVCDTKNNAGCAATKLEEWQKLLKTPNLTFVPLMSGSEYIYPFEVDYLSQPPLTDRKQLPNLTLSKVIIDGDVKDQVSCAVGEVIKGRVDLVDGFGKQRIMGGDAVRVWIVSGENRAVGHVIDLRNGSYQISVTCLWPGKIQLNVAVAYPREYLRTVIHQIHLGVVWFIGIKFKKNNTEEATLCSATPNIPGRPCVCNLTSDNQQSLYCGRPLDSRLSCNDWVETSSLPVPVPYNVTPAEKQLIKDIPKEISRNKILHNITIVVNSSGKLPSVKPCTKTSRNETWEISDRPNGYWTAGNTWESLICQRPVMTSNWTISCLKNTKVWVFGDSNGVRFSAIISDITKMAVVQGGYWPYQFINENKLNNISSTFNPLEYPLYLGEFWRKRLPYGSVAKQIDNIPSKGAQVLLIHYYLHIVPSHLNIAFLRLKALREAVLRLINRNPDVLVGIRGPHVSSVDYNINHTVGGDNLGIYFLEMIRHVFADLKHKVIFLDGWEMTIAMENSVLHPKDNVPSEMIRTLLAFKCS